MAEPACLVCGKPLEYAPTARAMTCLLCGKAAQSHTQCEDGHFVCDSCHSAGANQLITAHCLASTSKNPVHIAQQLMRSPLVHMHGPEHHFLVGAALLAAYKNAGGTVDLPAALAEMEKRAANVPGGACGFWGCCGAAAGTGMFISIVTDASPMATAEWGLANSMTGQSLAAIGALGGPRCCKRDSFTAIRQAAAFTAQHLGIQMQLPQAILCTHSGRNAQCIGARCPYNALYATAPQ